jgi:putative transposase
VGGRHHPRLRGGRLYIRLQEEFAYLAIIRDAFSRRVIGWAMADHLGAGLAVAALTMALTARRPPWGSLVHHSDRGVQDACAEYTRLLDAHGIAASMSRVGNPYDNAKAERFIRTLRSEEIDGTRYRDHRDAAGHLGAFIDQVDNRQRRHSALDYQTPVAFEAEHRARSLATAPLTTVGFQGIRKSTVMPDAQPMP